MKYKYIFRSPVKYWVISEDEKFDEVMPTLSFTDRDWKKDVNTVLHSLSDGFVEYMNNPGILDIEFEIYNGQTLQTTVTMDHVLWKSEFIKLYTDIVGQLSDGIGKKMSEILLYSFEDKIECESQSGMKEYKPVVKNVYCLLFEADNDWKLNFVSDGRCML